MITTNNQEQLGIYYDNEYSKPTHLLHKDPEGKVNKIIVPHIIFIFAGKTE